MEQSINVTSEQLGKLNAVKSIVQFPHPLTQGGLVLVLNGIGAHCLKTICHAYQLLPNSYSLYTVNYNALYQLNYPGVFAPPFHINERPHLPFYIKNYGKLLAGEPIQQEIEIPKHDHSLIHMHIGACRESFRRYGILPLLFEEKYSRLITQIMDELICLMATAVLVKGVWEINRDNITHIFISCYPNLELISTAKQIMLCLEKDASKTVAHHAVFQFEQFLNLLAAEIRKITV